MPTESLLVSLAINFPEVGSYFQPAPAASAVIERLPAVAVVGAT